MMFSLLTSLKIGLLGERLSIGKSYAIRSTFVMPGISLSFKMILLVSRGSKLWGSGWDMKTFE